MSFTSWLRNLRSALMKRKHRRQRSHRAASHRPRLELLEDRCLLSAVLVADLPFSIGELRDGGGKLLFVGDSYPQVLYRSDGTPSGTFPLAELLIPNENGDTAYMSILSASALLGDTLVFVAKEPDDAERLWKTDGTVAGTTQVAGSPLFATDYVTEFRVFDGSAFFDTSPRVFPFVGAHWKSDGTAAGTVEVMDIHPALTVEAAGTRFLARFDSVHGVELWKTDGTIEGTTLVKDIYPGGHPIFGPHGSGPQGLINVNGTLVFQARDTTGLNLWKSDGTAEGTMRINLPRSGFIATFSNMMTVDGDLFFVVNETELWKFDGATHGAVLLKSDMSRDQTMINIGETLFFFTFDAAHGHELWKSDGTPAGTVPVTDVRPVGPGWSPQLHSNLNGTLFFTGDDGTHGTELWQSDGTAAGTRLVQDINPGADGSFPSNITVMNGTLFFSADDGMHGQELWQSDGTAAGTTLAGDIFAGPGGSSTSNFTVVDDTLYFTAESGTPGAELWKWAANVPAPTLGRFDLAVTLAATPEAVSGQPLTYTATMTNLGPDTAANVSLTQALPEGVTFVSAVASQGLASFIEFFHMATVEMGSLAPGATVTLTVVVRPDRSGDFTSTAGANVDPAGLELNWLNNLASLTTQVRPAIADLAVTLTTAPEQPAAIGQPLTYFATATNMGPDSAGHVHLSQTLPVGVTFASAVASQGVASFNEFFRMVSVDVGTLASGASATLTVVVRPDVAGNIISTAAGGNSDPATLDANLFNNQVSLTTQVRHSLTDLAVALATGTEPAVIGQPLTYFATVTNLGPASASNASLVQALPAGVTFVSAVASQGVASFDPFFGLVSVELGALAPGTASTLTVVVRPNVEGDIVSTAAVVTRDDNMLNNQASVTTHVRQADTDVSVTLTTAPEQPAVIGQPLTYFATVTNLGPDIAGNVFLGQTLPAGVTFVSAAASQGSASFNEFSRTVTVGLGALARGATVTLTVVVRPDVYGAIVSTAEARNADPGALDANLLNNQASVTTEVRPALADLAVALTAASAPVVIGQPLTYFATVTNLGPANAGNVSLVQTVPTGVTFVSAIASQGVASFDPFFRAVSIQMGALASGATATLTVVLRHDLEGEFVSTAAALNLDPATLDANLLNNQASVTTHVRPALADLAVALTAASETVVIGQPLTYFATVTNLGPDLAANVSLVHALPAGVTFVSAVASLGVASFDQVNRRVEVALGSLPSGAAATLTVVVRPERVQQAVSTATVSNFDPAARDPNPANNRDSLTINVRRILTDLGVALAASPNPVNIGQHLTYTATVTNVGPDTARLAYLNQALPDGVTFISAVASQGVASFNRRTLQVGVSLGSLAAGATATLTVVVRPNQHGQRVSTATISNPENESFDPWSANNRVSVTTLVRRIATDLAVTLAASPDPVKIGQPLTYTATVTNFGPDTAGSAHLNLVLPDGATFISAVASQGVATFNHRLREVGVSLGSLAAGSTATLTVVVRPNRHGQRVSTATISNPEYGSFDPRSDNNRVSVTTLVHRLATDLAVTLAAGPEPVMIGQPLTYTATVTNFGPDTARFVSLLQVLSNGVTFISATASQGVVNQVNGSVQASLGSLASGATATLTVVVRPNRAGRIGSSVDAANQTNEAFDPSPRNNSAFLVTQVPVLADLTVTLADTPDPVVVGQALTYIATVTNSGPFDADRAILTQSWLRNVAFVSVISSQGTARFTGSSDPADDDVVVELGSLARGASATVTVVVRPTRTGILHSRVSADSGRLAGPGPAEASQQTNVQGASAAIGLAAAAAPTLENGLHGQSVGGWLDGDREVLLGDDYTMAFHRLFGDFDGDGDVDGGDAGEFFRALIGLRSGEPFDYDGDVDLAVDGAAFFANLGRSL